MLYANVLIGVLEAGLGGPQVSRFILQPSQETHPLNTSEITLSEVLVGPLRRADHDLLERYRLLFRHAEIIQLVPVTRAILERAAELRAVSAMRLPDAIHVATALATGCQIVLSQDKRVFVPAPARQIDLFSEPVIKPKGSE